MREQGFARSKENHGKEKVRWKSIEAHNEGGEGLRLSNPDLGPFNVRTDLAVEANQLATEQRGSSLPGVHLEKEEDDGIAITRVEIEDRATGEQLGKQPGHYTTLEVPALRSRDSRLQYRVSERLANELQRFMQEMDISKDGEVLVIGLGNRNVTPDALGPLVVENLLITRHLFQLMPDQVSQGYRAVGAISPGVLGITGMETSEIIYALVEKVKPALVVAVDALASQSLRRVNTTIQIADTGIHPGSGVGNRRKPVTQESLGVPVLAIGIPTVVDAATIVNDAMEFLLTHLEQQYQSPEQGKENFSVAQWNQQMMGAIGQLERGEKRQLIREVLDPLGQNLMVTPKEVDVFIEEIANLVANGLNVAFHEAINMENVAAYTH